MIVVIEGWSRPVHGSTPKRSLEAHVESLSAEMYVPEYIFIIFFVDIVAWLYNFGFLLEKLLYFL